LQRGHFVIRCKQLQTPNPRSENRRETATRIMTTPSRIRMKSMRPPASNDH
jgi:hypothetical protein